MRVGVTSVSFVLGRRGLLLLRQHVELIQITLDVAIGKILALLHAKDLTHGRIRVNGVALLGILELVRLDIRRESTSDIRRRHLSALWLVQEDAQLILDGHWGGEDGRALLLDGAIILLLDATAATTGLLQILGHALLEALEGLNGGNGLVADLLVGRNQARNLLLDGLDLGGRGGLRDRGRDRGSLHNSRRRSGWRSRLGLLRRSSRRSRGNGRNGRNGDGGSSLGVGLLGNFLHSGGGGGGGGLAHCINTGGSI